MARMNSYDIIWSVTGVPLKGVNMGATSTSDPIPVNSLSSWSINSAWTSTSSPVGNLDVQVCNAHDTARLTSADTQNWVTLVSLNLQPGTSVSPGLVQVTSNAFGWVRLVYTRISGGGTDTLGAQLQGRITA